MLFLSMRFFDRLFFQKFLEPEEQIVVVIHKHWWSIIVAVAKFVGLAVVLPISVLLLFWNRYLVFFFIPWIVYLLGICIQDLINWYHDALILTSKNILNIDWQGFFHRSANRISYDKIDGVEAITEGIFATLLGFGDLKITTTNGSLILPLVANVGEWQKSILAKKEEIEAENKPDADASLEQLKSALNSLLAVQPEADPVSYNIHAHQVMVMRHKKISSK